MQPQASKLARRSIGDHVCMVSFLLRIEQAMRFQILFDLGLDQSTFQKAIITQVTLTVIGHQKEVQLCRLHIAKL